MQKLDTQYAGLADSYYLAALPYLENVIKARNLGTLQCFALIAQYSVTTPTRTAAYWVVGLAIRLCQELRITDETTIVRDAHGRPLDPLEIDLRRRLFWICTSMELGLAHSLGRPSSLGLNYDHIDVQPFLTIDDRHITPLGIHEGSPPSVKKCIALHFMKMRLLQLEIRKTLYLKKRSNPKSDSDPWFNKMKAKLEEWMSASPRSDEGSGLSREWSGLFSFLAKSDLPLTDATEPSRFQARYNTMVVFLFRPSPQVPNPSFRAAQLCFDASKFNIYTQRAQIHCKTVDVTWIFTQSLFMAINTLLWCLSYPKIRDCHPKVEVQDHLQAALEAIYLTSIKWPGVESALELYITLVEACLKIYDGDGDGDAASIKHSSPERAIETSHTSRQARTPPLNFTGAQGAESPREEFANFHSESSAEHLHHGQSVKGPLQSSQSKDQWFREIKQPAITTASSPMAYPTDVTSRETAFDPESIKNSLPPPLIDGYQPFPYQSGYDFEAWPPPMGGYFSESEIHTAIMHPSDGLNLEQQSELMSALESNWLTDPIHGISPVNFVTARDH